MKKHLQAELEKYDVLKAKTENLPAKVKSQCDTLEAQLRPLKGVKKLKDFDKMSSLDFVDLFRLPPDKQKVNVVLLYHT